jgi:hypothetical protein
MNNEVIVTNKNPKTFSDGFGGMAWTFEPNKKVTIPLAAAIHIFGFNKQDKTTTLRRLGLANHPDGKQWLSNISMDYVEYVAKGDAEEAEKLRIDLEAKQAEIDDLNTKLAAATTEIEQLKEQLSAASKDAAPPKVKK